MDSLANQSTPCSAPVPPQVTGIRALRYMPLSGWLAAGSIALGGALLVGLGTSGALASVPAAALLGGALIGLAARAAYRRARMGGWGEWARGAIVARIQRYGGGTYGAVAASVWCYLEAREVWQAWSSRGPDGFLRDIPWDTFIGFSSTSLHHAITACTWPLTVMRHVGVLPAVAACWGAWVIDAVARRWLDGRRPAAMIAAGSPADFASGLNETNEVWDCTRLTEQNDHAQLLSGGGGEAFHPD